MKENITDKIIGWLYEYQTELYENDKACNGEVEEYMETYKEIDELLNDGFDVDLSEREKQLLVLALKNACGELRDLLTEEELKKDINVFDKLIDKLIDMFGLDWDCKATK